MTQEELADKVGTTKSYISKIENNLKEARISTLQKIVELGFGGHLELYSKSKIFLTFLCSLFRLQTIPITVVGH